MSDNWIRIVPSDPDHVPTSECAQALESLVAGMTASSDKVSIESFNDIAFVDAGANQGAARCPKCGVELTDDWWTSAMSDSYDRSGFADRQAVMPCCGATSDLNHLDYGDYPVAFARWWVDCMNPNIGRLDAAQIRAAAAALGHPVTVVYRHI